MLTLLPRFRWVVCQLDALRECPAHNVRQFLSQLPQTLDETYRRVLQGINKANQDDVYRLLQCLVVSMRPLSVEELAAVLAVDFDAADWCWEVQWQHLEAACSSLIAVVDTGRSRVVQFSHFSVKEFLTSPRLAASSDVSWCHISLKPAHTTLANACIDVLLRLGDGVAEESTGKSLPMAEYAAQHWVNHAQFEDVSSSIQKGMEELFNPDKPHFVAWVRLHDIDTTPSSKSAFFTFVQFPKSDATPLYYAALCGFHDLAKHLIAGHPQHANSIGGYHGTPLLAALARGYFQVADLLSRHGADVDVRGWHHVTPLFCASFKGDPEIVQWLLNHGANANAQPDYPSTPLHEAARNGHPEVTRILLKHDPDIKALNYEGSTPLHRASKNGHIDVVRLLLGHDVNVNARDNHHSTPLQRASRQGKLEVARALLEHGADVEAKDDKGRTAFQLASSAGHQDVARLLSEYNVK
jgi:ankyrin repeat protein